MLGHSWCECESASAHLEHAWVQDAGANYLGNGWEAKN